MALTPRFSYSPAPEIKLSEQELETRDIVAQHLSDGTFTSEDVPCFCGHTDGIIVCEKDRYGLPVNTVLCTYCGLMRTTPRMDQASTSAFYQDHYRSLYTRGLTEDRIFEDEKLHGQHVLKTMPSLFSRVQTVFEVGCGGGGLLLPLKEAGKEVYGCDLGGTMMYQGRKHGLDLVDGTASQLLEHVGKQADLVILSHVVEHFSDLRSEMEEIIQIVRPAGFFLIQVPGVQSISTHYQSNLLFYLQNAHNYHFTATTLKWMLESLGLHVFAADDGVNASVARPTDWSPGHPLAPLPDNEHLSVLKQLAEFEMTWQKRKNR